MASRSQQSSAKATRTPHVVAADLKAIGAPAAVARIDSDASVMSPLDAAGMAIKQQAVDLHHPVNPLVIGRLEARGQRLALEDGVDTSVAVGWQLGDHRLDLGHEFVGWQRRPANPFLRSLSHAFDQIGAGTSITSATVFIGNRPSAATAAAVAVFLTPRRVRTPP